MRTPRVSRWVDLPRWVKRSGTWGCASLVEDIAHRDTCLVAGLGVAAELGRWELGGLTAAAG
jgi:hypothetical protein